MSNLRLVASEDLDVPDVDGEAANRMRALFAERAIRRLEGLKLYEPMPLQDAFHSSSCRQRIIRGSNRAGKTLAAAVEVARAVTGQDPYRKYPKTDGIWYCVGKDGRLTGQVMWKKLGRPGAFKVIRDQNTKIWRAFRPYDPGDVEREKEARPAQPLIPRRMIKEISWENKKENLPKIVRLVNGWELHFFSSLGKPPHGSDIDGAWFDEEIVDRDWYPEMSARLVDRSGHFLWSATPQAGTDQLFDLHERAEKQASWNAHERTVEEFVVLLEENAHLTKKQKREFAEKLDEDEFLVRVGGQFALLHFKVFPEYTAITHEVEAFDVPTGWTRYLSVDPGRQICAVLFVAIPPPEVGDYAYIYDELYIPNCDAALFGEKMQEKCQGQNFEAFLIDHQESRKHETASGRTIEEQYSDELRKRKIACERTGCLFTWGAADPKGGVEAVRAWLRHRDDEGPKLRVMKDKAPNFVLEIKRYRYKRREGIVTDEPEERGKVHQMANLRYIVQSRPVYAPPRKGAAPVNPVLDYLRKKLKLNGSLEQSVNLGPGGARW